MNPECLNLDRFQQGRLGKVRRERVRRWRGKDQKETIQEGGWEERKKGEEEEEEEEKLGGSDAVT